MMHIYIHVYILYIHTCIYTYEYIHTHVHTYKKICVYIYMEDLFLYQARCCCDRIVELNIVNLTLSSQVKLVIMSATLQAGRVGGKLMKDEGGEKDVCCHCHGMFFFSFLPACSGHSSFWVCIPSTFFDVWWPESSIHIMYVSLLYTFADTCT